MCNFFFTQSPSITTLHLLCYLTPLPPHSSLCFSSPLQSSLPPLPLKYTSRSSSITLCYLLCSLTLSLSQPPLVLVALSLDTSLTLTPLMLLSFFFFNLTLLFCPFRSVLRPRSAFHSSSVLCSFLPHPALLPSTASARIVGVS